MSDDVYRTVRLGSNPDAEVVAIDTAPLSLDGLEPIGWIWEGELHFLPGKGPADLPTGRAWNLDGFAR